MRYNGGERSYCCTALPPTKREASELGTSRGEKITSSGMLMAFNASSYKKEGCVAKIFKLSKSTV